VDSGTEFYRLLRARWSVTTRHRRAALLVRRRLPVSRRAQRVLGELRVSDQFDHPFRALLTRVWAASSRGPRDVWVHGLIERSALGARVMTKVRGAIQRTPTSSTRAQHRRVRAPFATRRRERHQCRMGDGVVTVVVALLWRRLWCPQCKCKTSVHRDCRPQPPWSPTTPRRDLARRSALDAAPAAPSDPPGRRRYGLDGSGARSLSPSELGHAPGDHWCGSVPLGQVRW
jgi:hypothetical protein